MCRCHYWPWPVFADAYELGRASAMTDAKARKAAINKMKLTTGDVMGKFVNSAMNGKGATTLKPEEPKIADAEVKEEPAKSKTQCC